MATQLEVEEMVVKYVREHLKSPKYVLMDAMTYETFCQSFKAKERIVPGTNEEFLIERAESKVKLRYVFIANYELEILSVVTDRPLCEVVG